MPEPSEIAILTRKWEGKKLKPTLLISLDALCKILKEEGTIIDVDTLPDLMGSLHAYAVKADRSEQDALNAWDEQVAEMEDEVADSSEEDGDE